jgi:flagellar assembly factor FliW
MDETGCKAMQIQTSRFGTLEIEPDDVLDFPAGLVGFETCQAWVLLADAQNDALGWLQSTTQPEIAFAVVSPRRFVEHYQVRVPRSEVAPLGLVDTRDARVLVIVGKNDRCATLNLKAPLVINLQRRLGRQVVANGDVSLQYELECQEMPLKKSA